MLHNLNIDIFNVVSLSLTGSPAVNWQFSILVCAVFLSHSITCFSFHQHWLLYSRTVGNFLPKTPNLVMLTRVNKPVKILSQIHEGLSKNLGPILSQQDELFFFVCFSFVLFCLLSGNQVKSNIFIQSKTQGLEFYQFKGLCRNPYELNLLSCLISSVQSLSPKQLEQCSTLFLVTMAM